MRKRLHNLIASLAADESAFLRTRFLAPVAGGGEVRVRIAGAVCRMRIQPRAFAGWGVFRPASFTLAQFDREATLAERRQYLQLFPAARMILVRRVGETWIAMPGQRDDRFAIDGDVIVHGVDDADAFDTAIVRFDGERFWFDEVDPQAEPSTAAYLRESIVTLLDPRRLTRPGLTPAQRTAYAAEHQARLRVKLESERATDEYRLRTAVEHAGAKLRGFSELSDVYRVTYTVDGRRHTSVVRKRDLSIQSAGVCLSGQDGNFDLASLVSVLHEGQQRNGGIRHGLQV
jgi:hypothetical protein